MGMTKASLDLQLQQGTQKAIVQLEGHMKRIDQIMQIIDTNMRQSHAALYTDLINIRVRTNFLMAEMTKGMTEEDKKSFEERFKEHAKTELENIDKNIAAVNEARQKAAEEAALAKDPPNVVQ